MSKVLDGYMADIQEECRSLNLRELPDELVNFIKKQMANFALDCSMDSHLREEMEKIALE
jgi:hypothetical protein